MHPAQERARRELARYVLKKLSSGETFTRRQLFDLPSSEARTDKHNRQNWQITFLNRLAERKLITKINGVSGANKHDAFYARYCVAPAADLLKIDETELTRILWPGQAPIELTEMQAEAPETEAPETEAPETEAPETENRALETQVIFNTLKICAGLMDGMAYLRQRIERQERVLSALYEQLTGKAFGE